MEEGENLRSSVLPSFKEEVIKGYGGI